MPARISAPPMKVAFVGRWPKMTKASRPATTGSPKKATEMADGRTWRKAQLKTVWPRIVGTTASSTNVAHSAARYGASGLRVATAHINRKAEQTAYNGVA